MTAYEWRPDPEHPYRQRLKGPVVLLGVRQDHVTTSADFDWPLLHRLYAEHILDGNGTPLAGFTWQTTPAGPRDLTDKANWQSIVVDRSPNVVGQGLGHEGGAEHAVMPIWSAPHHLTELHAR